MVERTAVNPWTWSVNFGFNQAELVEGVVRLPEMWTQRRFDELHLIGASVDLGEALLKLFEPDKEAAVKADVPAAPPAPTCTV